MRTRPKNWHGIRGVDLRDQAAKLLVRGGLGYFIMILTRIMLLVSTTNVSSMKNKASTIPKVKPSSDNFRRKETTRIFKGVILGCSWPICTWVSVIPKDKTILPNRLVMKASKAWKTSSEAQYSSLFDWTQSRAVQFAWWSFSEMTRSPS